MRRMRFGLLSALFCFAAAAVMVIASASAHAPQTQPSQDQSSAPTTGSEPTADETGSAAASPSPEAVWALQAEAVLAKIDLPEDTEKSISDLFITKRREELDHRAEARAEHLAWRQEQMEQLQENNLISVGFLDQSGLQQQFDMIRKNKQKELAEGLVALVEKPTAEKLWPYFGAFNAEVDKMVEYLMTDVAAPAAATDSEEEAARKRDALLAAVLLVQDYAIALEQARWAKGVRYISEFDGREKIDRRVYNWYVERFRSQLISALNEHLESGRVEAFVKRFHLRGR